VEDRCGAARIAGGEKSPRAPTLTVRPVSASDPIDPSRETARLCVVCVEEFDLLPREHALDDGRELDSLYDFGLDQQTRLIESPD
jgi:hypothetical protein